MVERLTARAESFIGRPPAIPASSVYWALDGMFQHFLLAHLEEVEGCDLEFAQQMKVFFDGLFAA